MRTGRFCSASTAVLTVAVLALATCASAAAPTWSGKWRLDFNGSTGGIRDGTSVITLVQKGSTVTGRFAFQWQSDKGFGAGYCYTGKGGSVRGTTQGRTLKATLYFVAGGGHPRSRATFRATRSPNGRKLSGKGEFTTGECSDILTVLLFTGTKFG